MAMTTISTTSSLWNKKLYSSGGPPVGTVLFDMSAVNASLTDNLECVTLAPNNWVHASGNGNSANRFMYFNNDTTYTGLTGSTPGTYYRRLVFDSNGNLYFLAKNNTQLFLNKPSGGVYGAGSNYALSTSMTGGHFQIDNSNNLWYYKSNVVYKCPINLTNGTMGTSVAYIGGGGSLQNNVSGVATNMNNNSTDAFYMHLNTTTNCLYYVDRGNNIVRKYDITNDLVTTIAGGGATNADGILATSASLSAPCGITQDASGNIYITEYSGNAIRKINASDGFISTVVTITAPTSAAIKSSNNKMFVASEYKYVTSYTI